MPEFYDLWPEKFTNVTNGVTPRRWLASSNVPLAKVLDEYVGENWITNMESLKKLEENEWNLDVLEKIEETKLEGKHDLSVYIFDQLGITVDPKSMFDIHVKRIHEYKRQHLKALEVIVQYLRIKNGQTENIVPRTVVFGGKAAPGYYMAKLIIYFINSIASTINNDPDTKDLLKVIFLPNYSVKLGEKVYPAADLSEQISTAGKEASGTGNMKFQMNGALTIGTLDGANVEIRNLVGGENFFLFGKTEKEIQMLRDNYDPQHYIGTELGEAISLIEGGFFSGGFKDMFKPLIDNLKYHDPFFVMADFEDYIETQDMISQKWKHRENWNRTSLLNIARSGFFSSDRSIRDYCKNIWHI